MKLRFFLNGFCRKQGRAFLMGGLPLRAKKSSEEQKKQRFSDGGGGGGGRWLFGVVCASLLPSTLAFACLSLPASPAEFVDGKEGVVYSSTWRPPPAGIWPPNRKKNTHFPYPYPPKGGALENSKPLPSSIYVILSQNILRPHLITQ